MHTSGALEVAPALKRLSMTDEEKRRLAELEDRVGVTLARIRPAAGGS